MAHAVALLQGDSASTLESISIIDTKLSALDNASSDTASLSTMVQEEHDGLSSQQNLIGSPALSYISSRSCDQRQHQRRSSSVSSMRSLARSPSPMTGQTVRSPSKEKEPALTKEPAPSIKSLKAFSWPLAAFAVYGVTCAMIFGAPARYSSMIGRELSINGTWDLAVLSKLGDIIYAFAVEDAFNSLAWRSLQKDHETRSYVCLPWFMAMLSVTNPSNLAQIMLWGIKRRWKDYRAGHGVEKLKTRKLSSHRIVRWSFARLLVVLFILPGTGVILLANIQQKNVFYRDDTTMVSGGISTWDPALAKSLLRYTNYAPEISKWTQDFLRDHSVAWPLDGITQDCESSRYCESYLLAMPYRTIYPWPFKGASVNDEVDSFSIPSTEYWQVDLWDPAGKSTLGTSFFDVREDCDKYGPWNNIAVMLCIKVHEPENFLSIAWKGGITVNSASSSDYLRYPPEFGKHGESFHMAIHRRNASVAFSRNQQKILDVSDLGPPLRQDLNTSSWLESLGSFFSAPNDTANYFLFTGLANSLFDSGNVGRQPQRMSIGRERFSNLLTMTLLIHQPNFLINGLNMPNNMSLSPLSTNSLFGAEKEFMPMKYRSRKELTGTYCVAGQRSIPSFATVIAYAIIAGLLVVCIFIGKFYTFHFFPIKTSGFTLIDVESLVLLENEEGSESGTMSDMFADEGRYNADTIMDRVATLRVRLRDRV